MHVLDSIFFLSPFLAPCILFVVSWFWFGFGSGFDCLVVRELFTRPGEGGHAAFVRWHRNGHRNRYLWGVCDDIVKVA